MDELEEMEERDRERLERLLDAITLAGKRRDGAGGDRGAAGPGRPGGGRRAGGRRGQAREARSPAAQSGILRAAGPAADPLQRVQGHAGLPRREARNLGLQGGDHPRQHEARLAGGNREPGSMPSSSSGRGRPRCSSRPRPRARGSTCRSATSSSTTTSRGIRTASSSGWGASTATGRRRTASSSTSSPRNTIEGHVLERLLEKLKEIRDALDDDAVFNVVGEVLPAARVERVLRDYYAGRLGNEDLEDRLLRDVDESRFRNICRNALEGLASKKLNLEMLVERRAPRQGTPRRTGDDRALPAGRRATGSVETQVHRRVGAHVRAGANPFVPAALRARA